MAECRSELQEANPDFTFELYDDAACRSFIQTHFEPDVAQAYDTLLPGAFKADLWRYCVLYENGGIYLDIKFKCEPGFSLNTLVEKPTFVREYHYTGKGLYDHIMYTGCISAYPKNPLFMKCIRQIVENCETKYYGPEHTSPTGPYLFASMMDPDDIEGGEYSYYETDGIGHIRHIENKHVILSHYPEYRSEQKSFNPSSYWKDAWAKKEVYASL
jgi:mannosyltransferase OCH1-like enzyme